MNSKIRHSAVWIAALVGMAVGMLWYSPYLFESQWMDLSGMTPEKLAAVEELGLGKIYGSALLLVVAQSYVIAWFLLKTHSSNVLAGIRTAVGLWLLVSLVMAGGILWEGMPIALLAINSGYYLVQVVAMTVILSLPIWKRS